MSALQHNEEHNKLIVFEDQEIRRIWHNDEWYFSVLDVVQVVAETSNATDYFKKMRKRDEWLKSYVGTNCPQIALKNKNGIKRRTLVGSTESIFRIIQSIPSPKAEPFKQWLAKVWYERVQEIENPELAAERARQYYQALGYNDDRIAKRLQSIHIRGELTDEWKQRGVNEGKEYAILTAEISKATFGMKPSEYKEFKSLKKENLRDHMSNLELIFTMLGEESTKKQAIEDDAQWFSQNKSAAQKWGHAAGKALKAYEEETQQKLITNKNFKHQISEAKKKQKKLSNDSNQIQADDVQDIS